MSEASGYYTVIFSAQQGDEPDGYGEAAERVLELRVSRVEKAYSFRRG